MDGTRGPIFFYVGNEADVTLYGPIKSHCADPAAPPFIFVIHLWTCVEIITLPCASRYLNATGIMWESAPSFGALLVFAEHRYYGESKPFKKALLHHMQFLTSEQAMADYAEVIMELKEEFQAEGSAVIGFGGSYGEPPASYWFTSSQDAEHCSGQSRAYSEAQWNMIMVIAGGMLATWMRIKYPHILDGAIAGSAPIWSYLGEVRQQSSLSAGFSKLALPSRLHVYSMSVPSSAGPTI